jgi:hypothetical protein
MSPTQSNLIAPCLECDPAGGVMVLARYGQRHGTVIRCCERHGAKLVDVEGRDLPGPGPPVQSPGIVRDPGAMPVPPGQIRVGEAINRYIKCDCGCNETARVSPSVAYGSVANRFVVVECRWQKRVVRDTIPVYLTDPPAEEPTTTPKYLRRALP